MTTNQILIGVGLILVLAAASQVVASQLRIPALIILLPAGFLAGALTSDVNPQDLLGPAFQPLVSLAVAVILYDAGLSLRRGMLRGREHHVIRRLVSIGVLITFASAAALAAWLLGMSEKAALMTGAILVVSGPTVVGPLLAFIRPPDRLQRILAWEGSLVDPIGAVLGALVFHALLASNSVHIGHALGQFLLSIGVGVVAAAVGVAVLWLCLHVLDLGEVLATICQLAVVVGAAALADVLREDSGLTAAILMGLAVANLRGFDLPARRPFFETLVQLIIGVLFISISATVTPASLKGIVLPTLALVAILVIVVRPLVAFVTTLRSDVPGAERRFIGWMAPRGIVAAATASTFGVSLAAHNIEGASKILPVTFLVIVATVSIYGLTAAPVARFLHVTRPAQSRPLLLGGDPWAIELAHAFRSAGLDVLMWAASDPERAEITRAGVSVAPREVIAGTFAGDTELVDVTTILLLTDEDDFNALAATMLAGNPQATVYRLAPSEPRHGVLAPYTFSETLFAPELNHPGMNARHTAGAHITTSRANGAIRPEDHLLFLINEQGTLIPTTTEITPTPHPGDTLVLLTPGGSGTTAS